MKFGPEFRETHRLRDGSVVTLRMISPTDRDLLREGIARLSPESRYRRFLAPLGEPTGDMLRYLTEVDGWDHVAIVASKDSLDLKTEEPLAVARFVRLEREPHVAEAAVTVGDWFQGRGLGTLLAATLAEAARERGITTFRGEVLGTNEPMRKLLHEAGAIMRDTGAGSFEFDIPLDDAPAKDAFRAILRAAGSQMIELLRRLGGPPA